MEKLQHRKKDHFLLTWTKWNKNESNAWPSIWQAMFFCHMKVLGITAEYNPFHNGHLYQMDAAKKLVHPDQTVVAMSGNFTQRGEPAIADKWSRSKWAVLCGADLVFELPFLYACNRAPFFAVGGVDGDDAARLALQQTLAQLLQQRAQGERAVGGQLLCPSDADGQKADKP